MPGEVWMKPTMSSAMQTVARGIRYCRCENQNVRNRGKKYSIQTTRPSGESRSRRKIPVIRTPVSGRMSGRNFESFAATSLGSGAYIVQLSNGVERNPYVLIH